MKTLDGIMPTPRTYKGFMEANWNHIQTDLTIGLGKKIKVTTPTKHIYVKDESPFAESMIYRHYKYSDNKLIEMGVQFDPFKEYGEEDES